MLLADADGVSDAAGHGVGTGKEDDDGDWRQALGRVAHNHEVVVHARCLMIVRTFILNPKACLLFRLNH
jgi:hypothetical protein